MRNVISNVFKRGTLSFMSAVLALSTLTPVFTAKTANAVANGPLTVESVCDVDNTVKYNFTLKQTGLLVGNLYYKTPSGDSPKHTLDLFDTDTWSVDTNLGTAPSVSASAEVRGYLFNTLLKKYTVVTDPMSCAQLNGENFNTVNDPYKGISVGFNVRDFGIATAASVTIERADGSTVTKNAAQGVLDLISNATSVTQLTAPFVIKDGTFTEAGDTFYWAPAPATWTDATTPVKAIISVTDQHGTKTAEIASFSQGIPSWPTYFSLLPTPEVQVCSEIAAIVSNNLDLWIPTDTRSAGHNELVADGLRVYTDNNTSLAKATGYRAVDFPLSANGSQTIADSIEWVQNSGTHTPGLQLVVDFDNNGSVDGILVGEAVYGNSWWLSNSAEQLVKDASPNVGGGYGSLYYGTINEWLSKFPNAQVKSVGYSLGSGVHADGVIKKLVFGCTEYTFAKAVEVPNEENPGNTDNGGNNNNGGGSGSGAPVFAVADIFGINDDEEATDSGLAALGTASKDEGGEVAGATDNKDDKGCGIFLGICWYYWIPIVLAILAVVYAVRRRLQANNA